ncbi:type II secretion system protein GspM [Castellaniella hirudinis]|uniref:type II secretion system protein GspM n=1 Tax=Castellaniella hirudinis TaxID=1144617 RepID=UPI0039C00E35
MNIRMTQAAARLLADGRQRLAPFMARAAARWRSFSPREQRWLGLAGCVSVGALLWVLGVRPALHTLDRARAELPVLQGQAASLDAIVLEARALARNRHGAMDADATEQALRDSLVQAGVSAALARLPADAADQGAASAEAAPRWRLQVARASAGGLLTWLASVPQVARVRVEQLDLRRSHVDGRDRPGLLDGWIVLALPSEGRP